MVRGRGFRRGAGASGLLWALAAVVAVAGAPRAQMPELPPWSSSSAARQQALATDDFVAPSAIVFPRANGGTCRRDLVGSLVPGWAPSAIGLETAGAVVAGDIGRDMDALDHRCVGQVLEHAPTGRTVTWENPERGTVYRVTATRTVDIGAGRFCREYRTVAILAGTSAQALGTACRAATGAWQAVN